MLTSLVFLQQVKIKKSKKLTKIVKIQIFWETFNQISGKNVTYDDIKIDKKYSLTLFSDIYFLKHILRVKKAWISFEWNLSISFCRISNLSFI